MAIGEQPVLTIATIYPELLGTYGDGGNALVLAARARRRGVEVATVTVGLSEALPAADIYLIGGGEDGPQIAATSALRRDGSLGARLDDGAVVLAVCAGLQMLGTSFEVASGEMVDGLGLFAGVTTRGSVRHVGDIVVHVGDHALVGFENHGGETAVEGDALGSVSRGFGNDGHADGVCRGTLYGTYLHGPVLAPNPWFADTLLRAALGEELAPLATPADQLYEARLIRLRS